MPPAVQKRLDLETKRLYKCYAVLARMRPEEDPSEDAQNSILEIKSITTLNEKRQAVVAHCRSLLDRAWLFPEGEAPSTESSEGALSITAAPSHLTDMPSERLVINTNDLVATRVFKNMYDVHKSWIKNIKVDGNAAYREVAEQALRNNLYLFSPLHSHTGMFFGSRYYGAIRDQGIPNNTPITYNYSGYLNEPLEYTDADDLNSYWFRLPPTTADYIFRLDNNILKMVSKAGLTKEEREQMHHNLGQGPRSTVLGQAALPISTNPIGLFNSSANGNNFTLPLPANPETNLTFGLAKELLNRDESSPDYNTRFSISWSEDRPALCAPDPVERGFISGIKRMPDKGVVCFQQLI